MFQLLPVSLCTKLANGGIKQCRLADTADSRAALSFKAIRRQGIFPEKTVKNYNEQKQQITEK